ncbi:Proteasome adapter and scaffold protein ECM29 [Eumeta japonica]|uniref:Proteasome adapter and scaffold protein ECM29 n=1 Tax=Eumeta variegata TaxID=151549 RepID=A0A4C1TLS2_EUMVA|nr:Proteasome adapter and scaffold protein ECM29 [Eumeta japonica]
MMSCHCQATTLPTEQQVMNLLTASNSDKGDISFGSIEEYHPGYEEESNLSGFSTNDKLLPKVPSCDPNPDWYIPGAEEGPLSPLGIPQVPQYLVMGRVKQKQETRLKFLICPIVPSWAKNLVRQLCKHQVVYTDNNFHNSVDVTRRLGLKKTYVRTKVMELLVHVNKRVKCRSDVQLPVEILLHHYQDPKANSFIINFTIIYITMGFPRLPRTQQLTLAPSLLHAIENKPQGHQDSILMLVMPLLGEVKDDQINLKEKPKLTNLIIKYAIDVLLLPYRALPSSTAEGEDFQVPPGMSMKSYKRIIEKNILNADQLEEMKLSIVNFITKDVFNANDILLPLIVAAADSRFSVANHANSPLIRVTSSLDWSLPSVVSPLFSLYLGTWGGLKVPAEDRKVPACTRLRLKLIQYLIKATGPAIMFPHCVQVVFSSLFDPNSNTRLKNLALTFLLNIINSGNEIQLKKVATVFLQGILKVIKSEEYADQHSKAYTCLGSLATKCPECINNQFALLEDLVKRLPECVPEIKTSLRDALLEMAVAYKIVRNVISENKSEPMDVDDVSGTSGENDEMQVDENSSNKKLRPNDPFDEPQALALFALLDHYIHSNENMIRYIAMRYAAVVFPKDYVPSKYLLLLSSGDSQDDISTEALKYLYGTSRRNEIEDVVNNVIHKEATTVNIDQGNSSNKKVQQQGPAIPKFNEIVNYIWDQIDKRKKGSNAKHRFVINNSVLPFHPSTYQEILRYLRMCLNYDANLKNCSDHPNSTSPILGNYIVNNLLNTEVLDKYLNMIITLLTASPDSMPLTCFLDVIGCVSEKLANKYTNMLPLFKNLFTNSTREEIRETSAIIYAIITVHSSEKTQIEKEIKDYVELCSNSKNLEAQCGYACVFSHLCERYINMSKKGEQFDGKVLSVADWEPYKAAVQCLANFLSSTQNLLVSTGCTNIALLARCAPLPFGNFAPEQENIIQSESILKFIKAANENNDDTKEFEIHLQIGESLVLCVEGVNSNENRDLWTELPKESETKIRDPVALKENDELLNWLLLELFKLSKIPHPNSRQAISVWLLALLKNCSERQPIKSQLQTIQDTFMDFLSENSEIVQDVASKGLSEVYQSCEESQRQALVAQIIDQLTSGKRAVAQVTEDTTIFEEGQLGKAPTGGNLSTYKELCSLASDLNQPDLLYKFMHLAHHNSVWNSKKGAAFGFHSIALQAGAQLAEHLPKIVPRLYRYRFDPTPRIQNSMASIWHALVPETQKTVQKYHKEILNDLVTHLTSNQWRVRMSCCNALADLLSVYYNNLFLSEWKGVPFTFMSVSLALRRANHAEWKGRVPLTRSHCKRITGAQSLHDSLSQLAELWRQLFRVMDDVHEGTRNAATSTANVLSKLCIRASDINQGKDGKEIVSAILPVLLDTGITNLVREVRNVSLQTVSKLVTAAGSSLKPFLPNLIPALVTAAGDLESAKLSYLSTALGNDSGTREVLDDMRATAARHHYTTDTVVKCMPYIDIQVVTEMLPKMLELSKSPQLGTKVACCHFFVLITHHLRQELEPIAGKIMVTLLNVSFDRNPTVRKNSSEALGQISAYAKESSTEKLMKKLVTYYEEKDDDVTRSSIALILKAVAKAKLEVIKDNEKVIAPMVFLAMHAPKDEEQTTVEIFEEIWMEISPGRETGIRAHLPDICKQLEDTLNSRSWTKKVQASNAIKTVCREMPSLGATERERLLRALLAAAHGKTFDGKRHLLDAIAQLCIVKEGETVVSNSLAEEVLNALLVECRKQEPTHRRYAIAALGEALAALHCDRFQQVYEIVKGILLKDESSVGKESDEEDNEGAHLRREQLTALKEAAYELLGKAWPKDTKTQETYQTVFFEHCSQSYSMCSRSTQLAMLTAMSRVLTRLAILQEQAMDVDDEHDRETAVTAITAHVAAVVDYTLRLNYMKDLNKLKDIYECYATDLSKDASHEIRAKTDDLKMLFK